ncbi:MAG: DJ-1/PfpI family protein [Planctomycetota bacterium]|nr:MAG: DJ-1/PfpI family protein [Planctomycetota bacterium]
MARAAVLLAPGFEEIEALTTIDVLRRAGVEVVTAALGEREVPGAHGVTVLADAPLSEVPEQLDAVVLPGGMPGSKHLGESAEVQQLVRRIADAGGWVAAICAAPALALGPTGVLSGKRATCYPGFEEHFPADVRRSEDRVVVDGRLVTSRGPGTALEFALALAERLATPETAAQLREGMLVA